MTIRLAVQEKQVAQRIPQIPPALLGQGQIITTEKSLWLYRGMEMVKCGSIIFGIINEKANSEGFARLAAIWNNTLNGKADMKRIGMPTKEALEYFISESRALSGLMSDAYKENGKRIPLDSWAKIDKGEFLEAQRLMTRARTILKIHELLDVLKYQGLDSYDAAFQAALSEKTHSHKPTALAGELANYREYFQGNPQA